MGEAIQMRTDTALAGDTTRSNGGRSVDIMRSVKKPRKSLESGGVSPVSTASNPINPNRKRMSREGNMNGIHGALARDAVESKKRNNNIIERPVVGLTRYHNFWKKMMMCEL